MRDILQQSQVRAGRARHEFEITRADGRVMQQHEVEAAELLTRDREREQQVAEGPRLRAKVVGDAGQVQGRPRELQFARESGATWKADTCVWNELRRLADAVEKPR